jgi:hypothetical protein
MSGMDERQRTKDEGQGMDGPGGPHKHPIEGDMDRYLTNKASAFRYPPTPDIAGVVRNRLVEGTYRDGAGGKGARQQPRRAWVAMALTAVMVLGALMIVPGVRAFVVDFYVGVVHVLQGKPPPAPEVPVTPVAPWNPRLAGETDVGTLIARKYKVKLPRYPDDLGLPDHVYYQDMNYDLVLYVWRDREQADKPRLALYQIGARLPVTKELAPNISYTLGIDVGGSVGAWIEGQYSMQLTYLDSFGQKKTDTKQVMDGNTLVWYDRVSGYTYKLVGGMTMEEAILTARSLQPPSPVPTPYPTPTLVVPTSRLNLIGETSLDALTGFADFPIKLPILEDMPELGQPDKVYLQDCPSLPEGGQVVIMAWLAPNTVDDVQMALTQGRGDTTQGFITTLGAVTTTVRGNEATWVVVPQLVYIVGMTGEPTLSGRTLVTNGRALLWKENDIYYRLDTALPMSDAVRVAESLR